MTDRKAPSKLILLSILALTASLLISQPVIANHVVFVAPTYPEFDFSISDNKISESWGDITTYANLTEFGTGGFAKFAHNQTHMYALLGTTTDQWIAIEFDASGDDCMLSNHDTWIFYINPDEMSLNTVDSTFVGLVMPENDMQNDLYAEAIFTDDLTYVEVLRKFDTADQTSPDIVFANGSSTYLTFASDEDHDTKRHLYYLNIQFTDIGSIVAVEAPDVIDWQQIKEITLYGAMIFAVSFALTHYIVRQKLRPLEHGSRLIDSTIVTPPRFKERWNTLIHGVKTVEISSDSETNQSAHYSEGEEN